MKLPWEPLRKTGEWVKTGKGQQVWQNYPLTNLRKWKNGRIRRLTIYNPQRNNGLRQKKFLFLKPLRKHQDNMFMMSKYHHKTTCSLQREKQRASGAPFYQVPPNVNSVTVSSTKCQALIFKSESNLTNQRDLTIYTSSK